MKSFALFAFNGDPMCFVHVMLNALDLDAKGYKVKVVIEGSATALVSTLKNEEAMFHPLYRKMIDRGLVDGVCKACSVKMNSLEDAQAQGLRLLDGMSGHPSMADYIAEGYEIITF